jgi:hypothetical protein
LTHLFFLVFQDNVVLQGLQVQQVVQQDQLVLQVQQAQ